MSKDAETKKGWLKKLVSLGCAMLISLSIFFIILVLLSWLFLAEALFHFLLGWLFFLKKNLTSLEWNFEMLACGIVALILATFGLHRLLIWLRKQSAWKASWTISISALMLTLFGASIAMTGIIHQFGWLIREPFLQSSGDGIHNLMNLKTISSMLFLYEGEHGELPENLEALEEFEEKYLPLEDINFSPSPQSPTEPWVYFGAEMSFATGKEEATLPLIISPRPLKKRWAVATYENSVSWMTTKALVEEYPKLVELLPNLVHYE